HSARGQKKRPSAHPAEPGYPCYVSVLGELAWVPSRGEPSTSLPDTRNVLGRSPASPPTTQPRRSACSRSRIVQGLRNCADLRANATAHPAPPSPGRVTIR